MGNLKEYFQFSVKLIKVNRRSSLGNETLKDLLMLNTDGTSMENFNPDPCIDLWWQARPDQKKRKKYNKREGCESETENSSSDDDTFLLDDWDNWLDDSKA